MYENISPELIKGRVKERLEGVIDTREGSFADDVIGPTALELFKMYEALGAVIPIAFVDETSGEYLELRCKDYGITRKPGTKAYCTVMFTGEDGTLVPKGKVFLTEESLEFILEDDVVITEGTGSGRLIADEVGEAYNIGEGEITRQLTSTTGLDSFQNGRAEGGSDPETDEALCKRLYDFLQKPATSGNAFHYQQWASEVSGIGKAKVFPLANGPGTVKVVLAGQDGKPAGASSVAACKEHIEQNRPIGADVQVVAATGKQIDIACDLKLSGSMLLTEIKEVFQREIEEYFRSSIFERSEVLINRLAYMLLDIEGVEDFTSLTLNGKAENIPLGADEIAVLGALEVSEHAG